MSNGDFLSNLHRARNLANMGLDEQSARDKMEESGVPKEEAFMAVKAARIAPGPGSARGSGRALDETWDE